MVNVTASLLAVGERKHTFVCVTQLVVRVLPNRWVLILSLNSQNSFFKTAKHDIVGDFGYVILISMCEHCGSAWKV